MWGSVLGLGIMAALNPLRLGLALLMISRPRPAKNLLAYWLGGLTLCIPELLVPLMLLHFTPLFRSLTHGSASPGTGSTLGRIQIGLGVVGLSIAALMMVRFSGRQRAHATTPADDATTIAPRSNTAIPLPWLLSRPRDASAEEGSAVRRLVGRAHDAWENGSLWIAWLIGLISVPVDGVLFIVAIIVASGASLGTQVSASVAFVAVMYAVVEAILVSYVTTPAKTHELLRRLHDLVLAYRRQILVAMFAVVGISQLAQGMGSA